MNKKSTVIVGSACDRHYIRSYIMPIYFKVTGVGVGSNQCSMLLALVFFQDIRSICIYMYISHIGYTSS